MSVAETDQAAVDSFYRSMNAAREDDLAGLFTEDAEYVEPWTTNGEGHTSHTGQDAIRDFFRASWERRPPDMTVSVDRVDAQGERIRAKWTCVSAAFPHPMRGYDDYTVRDGKIARLETTVTHMPPPPPEG